MQDHSQTTWQQNRTSWAVDRVGILSLLRDATIGAIHLIPHGSNYTFLVQLTSDTAGQSWAIYKPRKGEAPLYDFPDGTLFKREYAAYLVSEALGWRLVPPTLVRDGPHGVGSVQLFIESDPNVHYFLFKDRRIEEARKTAAFDLVVNNADRKAGHCLEGFDGKLWLIDNGLTFNYAPKLRTVVWDFQGEDIPPTLVDDLARLRQAILAPGTLSAELASLLSIEEMRAFEERLEETIGNPVFPRPGYYRSVPWPPV
ncbi:MAG: SCO1664 family protein [Dehalococcoidia bacterium]|nr:SCO1664 family protein [Dehalococcoidia bacterium]